MTVIPEWLKTYHPGEVIEAALAYVIRNRVEADYSRSDLFEHRRRLMDDWRVTWPQAVGGGLQVTSQSFCQRSP